MSKTQSKRSGKQPGPVGSGARDKAWRARVAGLPATVVRFLENAADAISARRLREAERALVAAMALAPQHVEVIRLRGVLCHLQGRYAEAVTTLRDGLALHPDDAMTLNNLGSALRADGDAIEAIKAFERASELQPGLAAVWYNLGKTLKSQARIEDAKVALQRSLELEPGHAIGMTHGGNAAPLDFEITEIGGLTAGHEFKAAREFGLAFAWRTAVENRRLLERAQPVLADLARRTGETVSWVELDGDEIVVVANIPSVHVTRVHLTVGSRFVALPVRRVARGPGARAD